MSRSQHSKAGRLRLTSVIIGLSTVLALAGCAVGQNAETANQQSATWGDNANVENMALRNVMMSFPEGEPVYPQGSTAPVEGVLINEAQFDDRLLRVSSPYAQSSKISGITVIPGGTRLYADGRNAAEEAQKKGGPVKHKQVSISLVGLTQPIRPGVTIPVTFTFAKAGSVEVQVPIGPSPKPRPEHGSPEPGGLQQSSSGSSSHGSTSHGSTSHSGSGEH